MKKLVVANDWKMHVRIQSVKGNFVAIKCTNKTNTTCYHIYTNFKGREVSFAYFVFSVDEQKYIIRPVEYASDTFLPLTYFAELKALCLKCRLEFPKLTTVKNASSN